MAKAKNTTNCSAWAQLELQHIMLELNNQRTNHMRHFVDQWYCYHKKYVTNGSGSAAWSQVRWNENLSVNASKQNPRKTRNVTKEHVIPLGVVVKHLQVLWNAGLITQVSEIEDFLKLHVYFATITKQEDASLRKAGLNRKMVTSLTSNAVNSWNGKACLYSCPFERYAKVGIKIDSATFNCPCKSPKCGVI